MKVKLCSHFPKQIKLIMQLFMPLLVELVTRTKSEILQHYFIYCYLPQSEYGPTN
jgi:hypothetical protein